MFRRRKLLLGELACYRVYLKWKTLDIWITSVNSRFYEKLRVTVSGKQCYMARNENVSGLAAPLSLYYESINLPTHYFWFEIKTDKRFEILTHVTEVLLRIQIF
jgi:hypothetical protein